MINAKTKYLFALQSALSDSLIAIDWNGSFSSMPFSAAGLLIFPP